MRQHPTERVFIQKPQFLLPENQLLPDLPRGSIAISDLSGMAHRAAYCTIPQGRVEAQLLVSREKLLSRIRRILSFLNRMFPPFLLVPVGLLKFLSIYLTLQALEGQTPLHLGWRGMLGALSLILFMLLLRVYDELKDVETDLRLGRAGDPRYKDRPIVTGAVTVADLQALRWTVTLLLIGVNLPMGFPLPFAAFATAFLITWISFHWFFCPAISRSLLLAFATHNPMTLVLSGYIVAIHVAERGSQGLGPTTGLLLLGSWLPIAAWEISRKIRIPEEETEYATYSKILGWKRASLLPALLIAASTACWIPVLLRCGLEWTPGVVLLLLTLVPVGACLRFRLAPTSAGANLRPWIEAYEAAVVLGVVANLLLRYGIEVGAG